MNIFKIYLLFWTFSILGWIMEVIVCSISEKRIVNRGFLIGPYCPIYGFGATIMLFFVPYKDIPLVCFVLSLVLCSILEYFTSYIMEKMFKVRWWDYSSDSFNINGRVCLRNAIAFGALGVIFTRILHPIFMNIINTLSTNTLLIVSIIILVVTIIDIFISFNAMNKIKTIVSKNIDSLEKHDATKEIKKLVHETILKTSYLEKRLINTYHLFDKEKKKWRVKLQQLNAKSQNGYGLLLVFIILGVTIGLFTNYIFHLDNVKMIITYSVSLTSLIAIIILKVGNK